MIGVALVFISQISATTHKFPWSMSRVTFVSFVGGGDAFDF
jgi:hypothetical protein